MSKHGSRPSFATGTTTRVVSALVSFAVLYSIFLTTIPASAAPDPACDFSALSPGAITATVASELPDYLAGATVNLTGFGFAPGEIVCYRVSEDNPVETWNLKDSTLSDGSGNLAFSFAISADFIAQYRVRAWGLTSGVYAETTFTDAPGTTNKVYQHWADGDPPGVGAEWNNNILNDNKSSYFEGEVIPHVFEYKASSQTPLDKRKLILNQRHVQLLPIEHERRWLRIHDDVQPQPYARPQRCHQSVCRTKPRQYVHKWRRNAGELLHSRCGHHERDCRVVRLGRWARHDYVHLYGKRRRRTVWRRSITVCISPNQGRFRTRGVAPRRGPQLGPAVRSRPPLTSVVPEPPPSSSRRARSSLVRSAV